MIPLEYCPPFFDYGNASQNCCFYFARTQLRCSPGKFHVNPRSTPRARRRAASIGPHGDAAVVQAVLMLLVALISLYSFLLLVRTKFVVSGSFGYIGGALYGPWMRYSIFNCKVPNWIRLCVRDVRRRESKGCGCLDSPSPLRCTDRKQCCSVKRLTS
ncbi:hypothetical protein EV424DRAFT_1070983 [Suillus variegatus]|nr:hypothetical protein EV424DRAFT_1070983 [Suillus variegatus]